MASNWQCHLKTRINISSQEVFWSVLTQLFPTKLWEKYSKTCCSQLKHLLLRRQQSTFQNTIPHCMLCSTCQALSLLGLCVTVKYKFLSPSHAILLGLKLSSWSAVLHAIAGSTTPFQQELWIQSIKPIDFGDFVCTHEIRFKHHSEQCLSLSSRTVHNHPATLMSRYVHTICQLELLQNSCVPGFVVLAKHGCCTMECLSLGIWILLSLTSWGTGRCRYVSWPLHFAGEFKKSVLCISAQHRCSSCSFTGGIACCTLFLVFSIYSDHIPSIFSHLKSCMPFATPALCSLLQKMGSGKVQISLGSIICDTAPVQNPLDCNILSYTS